MATKIFTSLFSRKPEYYIDLIGMASDSVGNVLIDEKYALIQLHPESTVAVVPLIDCPHPSFDEVVFYTNYFTYAHDIPACLIPSKGKAIVKPIEQEKAELIDYNYFDSLRTAYESINAIRLGPLGYIFFRWPGFDRIVKLPITAKYAVASKEIGLYSTAVRQLDPLSEFLSYYRVIESISGNNGKDWINQNLSRLKNHNFGFLEFEAVGSERYRYQRTKYERRKNLFSFYRRRAIARLKELTKNLSEKNIAEYFYNETRCGIAHGKIDVKTYDFGFNIREISQDVYVLKLLSRIAIDDITA